ncbi:MAG: hypothetical protein GYA43_00440 [Bacteroidales bacterium]|nr:hypothetical protein [Bacteroidales bacterium]
MGRENIEKYSLPYALLKPVLGLWHSKIFYRRIIVLGRENFDQNDHLIFAPNHQNALMDALAVLFSLRGQPVFLARADIFKNRFFASLLYFLKILPVYRIRDGYNSLKNNDRIFDKTVEVLRNKNGLVILPEGNHEGKRRLRQLKKGICRIAFQAEEASDFSMNIKIIPVGIEFSHYYRIRQVLTVVFGKPIEISDFKSLYYQNQVLAINALKNRLSDEMRKLMVHIDSLADYDAIDELRVIVNGRYSDDIKNPKLFRDRLLIEKINGLAERSPEIYSKLCNLSLRAGKLARKLKIDYRLLDKDRYSTLRIIRDLIALAVTLPVFIYGVLLNFIFYIIPELFTRNLKDKQFYSTIIYSVSLGLAMLVMPVYLVISLILIKPWWLALMVFATIPVSGIFAWGYRLFFNELRGILRINRYRKRKNGVFLKLSQAYREIFEIIRNL